jgi:hypothetical protein
LTYQRMHQGFQINENILSNYYKHRKDQIKVSNMKWM